MQACLAVFLKAYSAGKYLGLIFKLPVGARLIYLRFPNKKEYKTQA